MLRQDLSNSHSNGTNPNRDTGLSGADPIDIQQELNKLEEMILDSPCIPLSRRAVVDEEQLLDQLDLIRLNLPPAFQKAVEIVQHQESLLLDAEGFAEEIITAAENRASQILDEMGIVQQAQHQAEQIRQKVQQDCELLQQQTLEEVERIRKRAQKELDEMHQRALAENDDIRQGADRYADQTLQMMEQQLTDVIRIIRNGRAQLRPEDPPIKTPVKSSPSGAFHNPASKSSVTKTRESDTSQRTQAGTHDRTRRDTVQPASDRQS